MTIQLSGHSDREQQKINTLVAQILADGLPLVGSIVVPKVSYNSDTHTYVLSVQYQGECYSEYLTPIQVYGDYEYLVAPTWESLMYSLIKGKDA